MFTLCLKIFIFLNDNYTQHILLKHNINHFCSIKPSYLTINVFSCSTDMSFKASTVYILHIIYVTDEAAIDQGTYKF